MSAELGSEGRPLRVAIVGSGPSAFYAADALFKSEPVARVDMFERLPAPFGLVRYGVAPDHAKIKTVIKAYEKTAKNDHYRFFGNVDVGRDIQVEELRTFYDAVVFASGAQTDRHLGIPGEDLPGSYTATEFVAWYNGHPEYLEHTFDLSHPVAIVIGQGNVAVDVCRILCKTVDELKETDIAAHALEALAESKVEEVHMIGRRGPVQAKFTPPELREFGELADCDPVIDAQDLDLNPASKEELENPKDSTVKKKFAILEDFAARPAPGKSRRFVMHFFESPKELKGEGKLERVVLEKNRLEGEPGRQKARGTGETFEMECGALFRSVGYRGVEIQGVPFDEQNGVFPNEEGRILKGGEPLNGFYAVGWIKRGPTGIIGTNKPDAIETIQHLVEDVAKLEPCEKPDSDAVLELLAERDVKVVRYEDWKKIDAAEMERGKGAGKPREKFVKVGEMIEAAGLKQPAG
jgi:ferredoxin--NADP+ reductase